MRRARSASGRRPASRVAVAAAVVVAATSGSACARPVDGAHPPCSEIVRSAGLWPTVDSAGSLAVAWALSSSHPEVGDLVATVAEAERRRGPAPPVPLARRFWLPDGVAFLVLLTVLTDHPQLATDQTLHRLSEAARSGTDGDTGIAGVLELVRDDDALLPGLDEDLRMVVDLARDRILAADEQHVRVLGDLCGDVPRPWT